MPDYAVRISHPYERIASMVSAWALHAETMAVYEHGVDGESNRVHCHMVITGTNISKKQLRNVAARFCDVKGNENCSFKEFNGDKKAYIYMTKGIHDPKYLLCIPKDKADEWKADWVEPSKSVVKVDKWTKIYQQFVLSQRYEIDEEKLNKLFVVKKCAREFVRDVLGMVFTVNALNIYKMLVRTFCYDEKITIPSGDKLDW